MSDILYILDDKENPVGVLSNELPNACPYWDDVHTERLEHGLLTLEFTIPASHPTSALLETEGYIVYPNDDGEFELFQIKEITESSKDGQYEKHIFCENAAVSDLLGSIIRPATLNSYTLEQIFSYILSGTGWELGQVDYAGVQTYKIDDYITALQAVHEAMDLYGAEIKFRVEFQNLKITKRYIDVLQQRGQDTGKMFVYGLDLADVERVEDTKDLVTALIGVGKADSTGQPLTFANYTPPSDPKYEKVGDWVGSIEARDRWGKNGKHIFGVYKDDQATNAVELYNNTVKQLDKLSKPRLTYRVDVVLLERLTGYEAHRVRLGDTIRVKDTTFKPELILEARVIERITSKSSPEKNKVTLGEFVPILTTQNKIIQKIQAKIQYNEEKWNIISQWQHTNDPTKIDGSKVYSGTISSTQISNRTITANNIATGAITSNEIANRTISSNNIATGAITSNEIAPRTIVGNNIATDTITANEIAPRTITANEIAVGAITANEIAAGAITADKIAAGSITSSHISTSGIVADSIKGGTLTLGGINNTYGKLIVLKDDETPVVQLDATTGGFNVLYVGNLVSPSVVQRNTTDYTIYVDPVNGDDANDGLTSSTQKKTLQAAFDMLPKFNEGNITILIKSGTTTWSESSDIYLKGIHGNGSITVDFQSRTATLNGRIKILHCTNFITFQNGTVKNMENFSTNQYYGCIHIEGCTRVYLKNMYFDARAGSKLQYCISVFYNSYCRIDTCEAYNGANAQLAVAYGSSADFAGGVGGGLIGSGGQYGAYIVGGGMLGGYGNCPTGTTQNVYIYQTGACDYQNNFTFSSGTPPAGGATSQTTQVWTATATKSYRDTYGWRTDNNYVYQGQYQNYGNHKGLAFFNYSDIQSKLSGKTIKSVRLYLSRRSEGGSSAAGSVNVYTHNYASQPAGDPTITLAKSNAGSYAWGEAKWISLPTSVGDAFKNGTAKGIALYSSTGSPYMIFNTDVRLEITYEG